MNERNKLSIIITKYVTQMLTRMDESRVNASLNSYTERNRAISSANSQLERLERPKLACQTVK